MAIRYGFFFDDSHSLLFELQVLLYEKTFLARYKSTILQQGKGQIRNIRWRAQFIAWASDLCIKIYDIEDKVVITHIDRERDYDSRFVLRSK